MFSTAKAMTFANLMIEALVDSVTEYHHFAAGVGS
jgi:hypothetical protein